MKLVARSLAWLLPLFLCACTHNPTQTQMQALAPPIEEIPPPPDLAPSALPQPPLNVPPTQQPVAVPPEPVKTVPKHHKPAKAPSQATAAASAPAQTAEAVAPPEESALGKIETPEAPDTKKQAENSIAEIERGLNGIGRKLNDQEAKTSMQIREFLKQARTDLASGDIDAANTLAKKARALLGELSQ
jgi:hypothetical protein